MYKVIFTLVLAIIDGASCSKFQGMAVYVKKPVRRILIANGGNNMTPDMQKMIEERMKKCLKNLF
jgi:hypothetical protein